MVRVYDKIKHITTIVIDKLFADNIHVEITLLNICKIITSCNIIK